MVLPPTFVGEKASKLTVSTLPTGKSMVLELVKVLAPVTLNDTVLPIKAVTPLFLTTAFIMWGVPNPIGNFPKV